MYHASNIGGGTYCLLNILKEIDREKFKPVVLLRTNGELVKEIKSLGIDVLFMPTMTLVPYNKSLWNWRVVRAYWRIEKSFNDFIVILEKIKPDAVYLNTMMLAPYLKIAKKNGYKTVIHLREHWPLNRHKKQLARIQSFIESCADQIIAINHYSASMVSTKKASIVYDWIDLSNRYEYRPFDEIFCEDSSKLKVYLFLGGLQDIKGAAEVVDMFSKNIKDKDKRLLMVGVEPNVNTTGLKNKVRYYLSKIGIEVYEYKVRRMISKDKRIVCIPASYALRHVMEQAYCILSFFTIPHANLAMAESIIVGTIPVAARTEESIEYSHGGELALLFELGSQDDFLVKLNDLDNNYDKIKRKISSNSHIIKKMFDKEYNVTTLDGVLAKLFDN